MMKKEQNDLWLDKIKQRLDNYTEPLPEGGWERLEQALLEAPAGNTAAAKKRMWIGRWEWAAVAAVFVAAFLGGWWVLRTPGMEEARRQPEPILATLPDVLPPPDMPDEVIALPKQVVGKTRETHRAQLPTRATETQAITTYQPTTSTSLQEKEKEPTSHVAAQPTVKHRPTGQLNVPERKKRVLAQAEKWSVGIAVGNVGRGVTSNNAWGSTAFLVPNPPMMAPEGGRVDMTQGENNVVNIPRDQEVVFENGLPYYTSDNRIQNIHHKMPISFGISVRKVLGHGFSVETGLTYTLLSSELESESSDKIDQKLHYIGIPLRANWNFVSRKQWGVYVSAGGAVEKSVYGKVGTEKLNVKPLQFSLLGAIGAQYNLTRRIGVYIEPGVSYYFDDGSAVETIRKETPLNFTLQAGFRLTY
ncbi:MAG: PorT family protein [Prevotellaceae bacterium]|nr:PorT family protein [Prevotellaceae bacterium]